MTRKKNTKKKERYKSLNHYLNQLLKYELKRLIDIKKRKRRRGKLRKKPIPPTINNIPGIIPKMTVISNSDEKLVKEQQDTPKITKTPELEVITNKPIPLPSSYPVASPKKRIKGGLTLIDNDTGVGVVVAKDEADEIWAKNSKIAQEMREEINESKQNEAYSAQKLNEMQIYDSQNNLKANTIRKLHKIGSDAGKFPAISNVRKDEGLKDLNTVPGFKDIFEIAGNFEGLRANDHSSPSFLKLKQIIEEFPSKQTGEGSNIIGPLSNLQIDELMKNKGGSHPYLKTFAIDTLQEAKNLPKSYSFITNTSPISDPKVGHWVAVRADPKTVEYYDPLGMPPNKPMLKALVKMVGNGERQFKINRMRDQAATTQTCGPHCMKFLDDREEGKPFKEATGFNKLGEKQVAKYMQKYKEFGII